ncbi:transmembrane and coiled-coil domain-containing protein 4-like protein [Tanacetum coccineum]
MTKINDVEANLEQFKSETLAWQKETSNRFHRMQELIDKNKADADKQFSKLLQLLKALQPPTTLPTTIPRFEENSDFTRPILAVKEDLGQKLIDDLDEPLMVLESDGMINKNEFAVVAPVVVVAPIVVAPIDVAPVAPVIVTPVEPKRELALSKAVDTMVTNIEKSQEYYEHKKEKHRIYAHQWREKFFFHESMNVTKEHLQNKEEKDCKSPRAEQVPTASTNEVEEKTFEEAKMIDRLNDDKIYEPPPKGYDARHCVALRLLTTWFDIKWINMEAMEEKLKRGGLIGASAITGGTLMEITGGVGPLAPTLGTIMPMIGAGGFAAVASVAGSVAGSVAVAASFVAAGAGLYGAMMARRTGSVDEFEFKAIGDNHNQGGCLGQLLLKNPTNLLNKRISHLENFGLVLVFVWYALQWESEHLIAVSTAIQDWLTSRIAMEMMKQANGLLLWTGFLSILLFCSSSIPKSKLESDKAKKLLAEVLVKGLQGTRPVILIDFSLGAQAIFKCLENLAECNHAGIVERVVVPGRLINAYSTNDWMFGVAFRASLLSQGLAGIQPVDVPGIENVDVTEIIKGHSSYLWST